MSLFGRRFNVPIWNTMVVYSGMVRNRVGRDTALNFSWIIDGRLAGHAAPVSQRDLERLKGQGILALVRMAEKTSRAVSNEDVEKLDIWDCHVPVPDYTAPTTAQIDTMAHFIDTAIAAGRPVGVSCGAGLGRTGTILACYLVSQGYDPLRAIEEVRARRPGSIETKAQSEAVYAYARQLSLHN
jgi:atypical dual specificity phosphatase